jgi:hypothetical protein
MFSHGILCEGGKGGNNGEDEGKVRGNPFEGVLDDEVSWGAVLAAVSTQEFLRDVKSVGL